MADDKEIRTDGRTDKEIRIIAAENITNLTDNQLDRLRLISPPKQKLAHGGKACRGRSAQGSAEKNG
tara:strand:+ start:79 stop:279 length:201 start_codon:yes stop_codon:yes gene_type:complete